MLSERAPRRHSRHPTARRLQRDFRRPSDRYRRTLGPGRLAGAPCGGMDVAWEGSTWGLLDFRAAADYWELGFQYAIEERRRGYQPPGLPKRARVRARLGPRPADNALQRRRAGGATRSRTPRPKPASATSSSGGLMRPARASRNARSSGPSRNPGPPAMRSASSVAVTAAFVAAILVRAKSRQRQRLTRVRLAGVPSPVVSKSTIRAARSAASSRPSRSWTLGISATEVEPSPGRRSSAQRRRSPLHPPPPRDTSPRSPSRTRRQVPAPAGPARRPATDDKPSAGTRTPRARAGPTPSRACPGPRTSRARRHRSRDRPGRRRHRPHRPCRRRAVTKASRSAGSHVVQVFSPVSRHPSPSGGRGARDGATRGRAAAFLGRRVVDQRALVDDRA